ncbi:MAG: ribonuclease H [Dehalococcoidia bacterium]|nr:ribonuclease H [Dehalococcoidia bacterium]
MWTARRRREGGGGDGGDGGQRTDTTGLRPEEVLKRFTGGPTDGVFTDGSCQGNPGAGGWGAVWVEANDIVAEKYGYEDQTTNNRMEFTAIIAALEMLPEDAETTVYTDSNLVVNTLTKWAEGWEKRGWKRKDGEVKNLDLVKRAYELHKKRPGVHIAWIRAHDGSRWNEYADALATAHRDERTGCRARRRPCGAAPEASGAWLQE